MAESIVSDVRSKIRNFEKNNYKNAKSVVPSESKIKDRIDQINKTNQEAADDRPKLKKGKAKRILKPGMYLVHTY